MGEIETQLFIFEKAEAGSLGWGQATDRGIFLGPQSEAFLDTA